MLSASTQYSVLRPTARCSQCLSSCIQVFRGTCTLSLAELIELDKEMAPTISLDQHLRSVCSVYLLQSTYTYSCFFRWRSNDIKQTISEVPLMVSYKIHGMYAFGDRGTPTRWNVSPTTLAATGPDPAWMLNRYQQVEDSMGYKHALYHECTTLGPHRGRLARKAGTQAYPPCLLAHAHPPDTRLWKH
jgi:hypothetical protein